MGLPAPARRPGVVDPRHRRRHGLQPLGDDPQRHQDAQHHDPDHPKFMVALYSPDNKDIVNVFQQNWENGTSWDDSNTYLGWQLDWVDSHGNTVPW
jgi:hypothetical protein